MRNVLCLLILQFIFSGVCGQTVLQQTIRGRVSDKQSDYPLEGASITVKCRDSVAHAITDARGEFRFRGMQVGRYTVQITYLGYKPYVLTAVELTSGKELVLPVQMEEQYITAGEVTITAEKRKDEPLNKMALVSARSFTVEETERYAGSFGDPSRMAQNFAGVKGSADQVNDIIIRGNSPAGLLWKLDGVHIPNPNHFGATGATGGPVSMLNNNQLGTSDFFTGAFPT